MGARTRNSTASVRRGPSAQLEDKQEAARRIGAVLAELWPNAVVEIDHQNPYQLLVGTILAAQSTDKMINSVTPALFARFPNATALATADQEQLEQLIHSTGFYRMKAKHLLGMARAVVERHGGEIPSTMEELVALPGAARKTANVVLGAAFKKAEGIVVDTHVTRLSAKLGLTEETDAEKIEEELQQILPRSEWVSFADRLIWHGRRVCFAKKPACESCQLAPLCPSAGLGGEASPEKPEKPAKVAKEGKVAATATGGAKPQAKVGAKPEVKVGAKIAGKAGASADGAGDKKKPRKAEA